MRFVLEMDCNTSGFDPHTYTEVAQKLWEIAHFVGSAEGKPTTDSHADLILRDRLTQEPIGFARFEGAEGVPSV